MEWVVLKKRMFSFRVEKRFRLKGVGLLILNYVLGSKERETQETRLKSQSAYMMYDMVKRTF